VAGVIAKNIESKWVFIASFGPTNHQKDPMQFSTLQSDDVQIRNAPVITNFITSKHTITKRREIPIEEFQKPNKWRGTIKRDFCFRYKKTKVPHQVDKSVST